MNCRAERILTANHIALFAIIICACCFLWGNISIAEGAKKESKSISDDESEKTSSKKRASSTGSKTRKVKKSDTASDDAASTDTAEESLYANVWRTYEIGTPQDKKAAISELKNAVKQNPSDGTAHYYLGIMLSDDENFDQAKEHLQAAALVYPQSTDVLYKLGEVLQAQKKEDEAFALFDKVITIDPNHGGALGNLGMKAIDEGAVDKAIEMLTKAKAANPDKREILRALGEALYKSGRYADAVENFDIVIALDDTDSEVHFILGKCYDALGKSKEASEEFEKAKAQGKRNDAISNLIGYDLARTLYQTGKIEDAVKEYKKTIRTATDPAIGLFELGNIYEDLHSYPKAMEAFGRAFELDPKLGEAQFRLAKLLREDDRYDEAIEALKFLSKRKGEWADKAKDEIDEITTERDENKKDDLMDLAKTGSEDVKEKALHKLLEIDKKDQSALEGLKDLALERGDLDQGIYYIKELKKAGHLTKQQADIQIKEVKEKIEAGENLAEWESRFEQYKREGNWDKAIEQHKKIKAYALSQMESWKRFSPKNKEQEQMKKQMMKITRVRLKNLSYESKDLNRAKNPYK